ncbi:membrane-associated progesterone receptor component 1-like isoform X2 [Homarus americanus]|uniref:Membrane-associated progesterone receptor component 2-like n=1 Tax=Homarus americanus TaxID=6706 RepID=A0A8J5MQ63_HOMAM|nr:membrane-associated progesterone receptor component 1-like isoform X2 [Homarus americanus]KAG7159427.1 Membrane-associated progesterone receptor component 2-like [Homarus americanus]
MAEEAKDAVPPSEESLVTSLLTEIFTSPINIFLLGVCVVLIYKIFRPSNGSGAASGPLEPPVPKMKRQDMNLAQLKQYDGTGEHGRVCVAVNGKVFDVTRGKKFYGPGGPYAAFAGHDATRALATFSVNDVKEEYDDLSDLSSMQMDSVREWEMQFTEKYDYIGKFLKSGEQPTEYSDEEDAKDTKSNKED